MTWYQYLLLSLSVVLYALSQLHQFGKLIWQDDLLDSGFFGQNSWHRKYKKDNNGWLIEPYQPAYFGSTTFLVMFTDFYHACQAAMKITLSIGIFNFTIPALYFWLGWTAIQWLTFKIASR